MIKIISSKDDFVPELPDVWDEIRDLHVESGKEGVEFGGIRTIESETGRVEFGGIRRINSEKDNECGSRLRERKRIVPKDNECGSRLRERKRIVPKN